eukprot:TRINITY_DN3235_c0_g1_i1.p1 TRINITY_DN3235_c0_g1~~TRINITY_DN3235_c0_g1_i1.p1  ORF type:complete len:512 (-),score=98.41 TRINITY_DN3235_c0_g1_i1:66-1601(-)
MDDHYKNLHETFVANNGGSQDPWEILGLSLILPASYLLSVSLSPLFSQRKNPFLLENAILCVPILLALTCCSEKSAWILLGLLGLSALIIAYKLRKTRFSTFKLKSSFFSSGESSKRVLFDSINAYRGSLLLLTSLSILAVDFPVFPRRFGKTEAYGYGFMDCGVGSFVFANGLLAPEARGGIKSKGIRIWGSFKSSFYLILIGAFRLLSVKSLNYQEHVTEYGVHWNFFFTLAAVKVASTLCLSVVSPKHSWILSLFLGLLHEGILSTSLGATYILDPSSPRDNIFSSNREGIMSLLGYIAIYLAAVYWGTQISGGGDQATPTPSQESSFKLLKSLFFWSIVMWGSLLYSQELFLLPSRRMANWPYFNWMLALNLSLLGVFLLFELIRVWYHDMLALHLDQSKSSKNGKASSKGSGGGRGTSSKRKSNLPPHKPKEGDESGFESSPILSSICYNGLPYFLLSNLLTGLINMSIETIFLMNCLAILILFAYSTSLNLVSLQCFHRGLRWKG